MSLDGILICCHFLKISCLTLYWTKFRTNLGQIYFLREDKFISFERGKSFNIMKIIIQTKNAYLSDKLNIYTYIM